MVRRNNRGQGTSADTEVHMMETDIMRFLAIISLCLAIVFAIASGKGSGKSNTELKATPQQVTSQKETVKPVAIKPIAIKSIVIKPIATQQVTTQSVTPKQITTPQSKITKQPVNKHAANKANPTTPTTKKGFQLSFESDSVFTQLIQQQKIKLFKFNKKQTYHWQGGWLKVEKPLKYYQLHRETLPSAYQTTLQATDTLGVVLSKTTEKKLQQLVNKYTSGLLVINSKANVLRKPTP